MTTAMVQPEVFTFIGPTAEPVVEVPAHDVIHPAETLEFDDFEDGIGGWSAASAQTSLAAGSPGVDGSSGLMLVATSAVVIHVAQHTITGLTPGREYEVTAHIKRWAIVTTGYRVSVLNLGSSATVPASADWVQVSHSFIATASTATMFVQVDSTASGAVAMVDNVSVVRSEWTEHIPAETTNYPELRVVGGSITLDENYAPYVTGTIDVPLESLEILEQIDPRLEQEVYLYAMDLVTDPQAENPRPFLLGLRSRTVDHKAGVITLEVASGEAKLIDTKRLATTVDRTPRQHEASMRAICSWALGKIGATLEPGTDDADMTAAWDATNLLKNPDADTSSAPGWATGSGLTTIAHNTGAGMGGAAGFIRATQTGVTGAVFLCDTAATGGYDLSARPGQIYTVSAYAKHSVAGASATITLRFLDANNATIKNIVSTSQAMPTTWGTRWSVTAVAPPNAVKVAPYMSISGTASGRTWDIDRAMLTEGPDLLEFFDGNAADTSRYTYSWEDAANASTSTRIATPERLPELFDWKPGQSLNDFLRPLLEASGLRLFCDELGAWRLIDPATYEVPGYVVVQSGFNATEGTDSISRNTDDWADGVVVVYRWRDEDGNTKESYDIAGTDGKVLTVERESEYPGPGAAAYILNSLTGRGRTQEVTALVNFGATPAQDVTISLPGALTQTGKVRRVTFGLSGGLMQLETRGLTDTLPGSWAAWDPAQVWADVDPALVWKDA